MAARSNPRKRVTKTSPKTTRRKAGVKSLTRRAPAAAARPAGGDAGRKIERSVTINRTPADLFDYWRDFSNLPLFMENVETVEVKSATKSHWVARGPGGARVQWDAEITSEKPGEMIQWRSTSGDIDNSGAVFFSAAPADRGTYVKVVMSYSAPGSRIISALAKLVFQDPDSKVREDLRRFKRIMEASDIPTTDGQPSGRR